ncbi:MAG: phosphoribosylamine--glycine ligase [Bacteroidota bacterium]
MNILLIGSGGREHALAWKMSQSSYINKLYIAPGNAGTSECGVNVDIDICDFDKLKDFALSENIQLIVVGPELPLVNGIYNYFREQNDTSHIEVIGPSSKGAMLEGSKHFAKEFMLRNNIPTASFKTFSIDTLKDGIDFIDQNNPPYVLKADGLASGKGVVICQDKEEAIQILNKMLKDYSDDSAYKEVLIEQFLSGIELSVFIATDGKSYVILPEAKDYKRIGEGDTGLNTGGMGAVSPVPFANEEFMSKIEERIIKPTMQGLINEEIDYKGFIFFGIMNSDGNPYLIEYNCRLGDPETQAILPRINNDIIELFERIAAGTLDEFELSVNPSFAATVILASGGYPKEFQKHFPISFRNKSTPHLVFHAGTSFDEDDKLITNGGRVMAVTSIGEYMKQALDVSYYKIGLISFNNMYFRKDIGQDLLSELQDSMIL